ncbi:hypothetical protein, partial [Desulfobulbus alkaliphilus]|uniref:hypothetical protein n=1 Tax=Desulfobulbus alkaliphilus TaxID=869814 RepID=UPI001966A204
ATPITGTTSLIGTILPAGDRDHYLFEAPHHGEWTITTQAAPPGVELAIGVFPYPSGAWLSDRARDDSNKLVVDLPEPGKYVLRVSGRTRSMRSVEPYRLMLEFR